MGVLAATGLAGLSVSGQLPECELGEDYFDKRDVQHTTQQLVKRLDKLGFEVALTRKAA